MPTKIFDDDGAEIAEIDLSEKQERVLDAGEEILVIYHTPQILRHLLGQHNGSFTLHKRDQSVIANDVDDLRAYAGLQHAIKATQRQTNGGE